jgi:hypothetical protein
MQQRHRRVIRLERSRGEVSVRGRARENAERTRAASQLTAAFWRGGSRALGFGLDLRPLTHRARASIARVATDGPIRTGLL